MSVQIEPSTAAQPLTPTSVRGRLFRKYALLFAGIVSAALIANGLLDIWFSYREQKALLVGIQREKADAAAAKISHFVKEIEGQMGWTTQLAWSGGRSKSSGGSTDASDRACAKYAPITGLPDRRRPDREPLRPVGLAGRARPAALDRSQGAGPSSTQRLEGALGAGLRRSQVRALHDDRRSLGERRDVVDDMAALAVRVHLDGAPQRRRWSRGTVDRRPMRQGRLVDQPRQQRCSNTTRSQVPPDDVPSFSWSAGPLQRKPWPCVQGDAALLRVYAVDHAIYDRP